MQLNILSGMAMYEYFNDDCFVDGLLCPFNEAMCEGSVSPIIFGDEFVQERCVTHLSEQEDYENLVLQPLRPLFEQDFDKIVLWFDEDMFCQINLLTLLGYIDMANCEAEIVVNLVDCEYNIGKTILVNPSGFYALYLEVMIKHNMPSVDIPITLRRGIDLYLEYKSQGNKIEKYICENIKMKEESLVSELFNNFAEYGLGDLQYFRLIDKIKNRI